VNSFRDHKGIGAAITHVSAVQDSCVSDVQAVNKHMPDVYYTGKKCKEKNGTFIKKTRSFNIVQAGLEFHNHLIRRMFNTEYSIQNYTYFSEKTLLGILKTEYMVYLCVNISIGCICKNYTANYVK